MFYLYMLFLVIYILYTLTGFVKSDTYSGLEGYVSNDNNIDIDNGNNYYNTYYKHEDKNKGKSLKYRGHRYSRKKIRH